DNDVSVNICSFFLFHYLQYTIVHVFVVFLPPVPLFCCPTQCRKSTGVFFGEAEGAVMSKLVSMGSFKRVNLYDYRSICRVYAQTSDTAHTLLHVSTIQSHYICDFACVSHCSFY
uniref:Voltage-dependent calcium channel alpha-2/delta subunit conserved region domain-containing protein n=1 Tax=Sinocyclocheilus grahami TaxID=75366 RepID=A0A672NHS2_SINGR